MKTIKPYIKEIIFHVPEGYTIEQWLERAGRICYKSEDKITINSAKNFLKMLVNREHWAMLEHCIASVHIIADRGLMAELTRHRIASFAVESTRYCSYIKGKFGGEITVIEQPTIEHEEEKLLWNTANKCCEFYYMELLKHGIKPEIARSVLPIGIKSEMIITANLREWNHIFNLRCSTRAHPIIRRIMLEILQNFNDRLPFVYDRVAEKFLKNDKKTSSN